MVQNNKVLTVSYGTFSCTLEGFEDSFDTMKAIAEYFRDLAADDRYFGAEPPQPDAEMLARIAQKEIARQVEAHASDSGIHLRAATAQPAAQPAPLAPPQAVQEQTPDAPVETDNTVDAIMEPAHDTPAPTEPAHETAISADPAPEVAVAAPEDDTAIGIEEPEAPEVDRSLDVAVEAEAEPEDQPSLREEEPSPQSDPEAEIAAREAEQWGADRILISSPAPVGSSAGSVESASADTIAAKLQRIRAVVAKSPAAEQEFIEDEHAESFPNAPDLEALEEAVASDPAPEDEPEPLDDHLEEDVSDILKSTQAALLNAIDQPIEEREEPEPTEDSLRMEAAIDAALREDEAIEAATAAEAEDTAELEDTSADAEQSEPPEPTETAESDESAPEEPTVASEPSDEPAAAAPLAPRRPAQGRVIRVKRAHAARMLIDGSAETASSDQKEDAGPEANPEPEAAQEQQADTNTADATQDFSLENTSLSAEEEADLLAELEAVEAELLATSSSISQTAEAELDTDLDEPADESLFDAAAEASMPEADDLTDDNSDDDIADDPANAREMLGQAASMDGDVARLMAVADDHLNSPDTASSRDTYNQLRAAVAAAQNDDTDDEADTAKAFQEDLAQVIRPRRPASDTARKERPARKERAAPLKLVAEQRIDAAEAPAEPAAPVRPRRISTAMLQDGDSAATEGSESAFAEYAAEKGAVELDELLEAAASYMSFVEGRDSFSRPQLINKIRTMESAPEAARAFNREDSLRYFGQLLREGKLERASNGRFTASQHIGFRPGNRAAS